MFAPGEQMSIHPPVQRPRALTRPRRRIVVATLAALALVAGACTDDSAEAAADVAGTVGDRSADLADIGSLGQVTAADHEVRPGPEQVTVQSATPGERLALFHREEPVEVGTVDSEGALIFREVPPGAQYRVAEADPEGDDGRAASDEITVPAIENSTPDDSFYEGQQIEEGFGYIETRDGTTLSASVYLPGPPEEGPYPTVVEYSGYSPAKPPSNLLEDNWEELSGSLPFELTLDEVCELAPFACAAPNQPGSLLAHALGYAVVAVNMRGTGCSGGSYDFFEPLQLLDGYDVIETVAAQDWVANGRVGMVGLSYPGLSQLFVASTQPPSLAAITPQSVYDDTARGVLAPGGIFNAGFAFAWAESVLDDAVPFGQGWEQDRVDAGDATCAENQRLRGQNVDVVEKARRYPYYEPSVADPLNPSLFVEDIEVPVFLTGSFQDEQTGGRFPLLFERFTSAPVARFAAWNGAHADGFAPQNLVEWKTFLDFYVAGELTDRSVAFDLFAPVVMDEVFGVELELPPQRTFDGEDFESKRASYEAEPPIRVLFENGAGDPDRPGAPVATTEVLLDEWPPPGDPLVLHARGDGTLSPSPAADAEGSSRFRVEPELAELTTFVDSDDNNLFRADVEYTWIAEPEGAATVFVSEPLDEDVVLIGSASADLWIRSSHEEADLGVTLSEVRPDGQETYVQSGVLRGSHRAVGDAADELLPWRTHLEADTEPLPTDEFVEARVEIFPFAHVVRAGSRIRLSVHTPGGDRTRWTYELADHPDDAVVDVGHDARWPTRLVLPAIDGITGYPTAVPDDCTALRAQPCRTYEEYTNRASD